MALSIVALSIGPLYRTTTEEKYNIQKSEDFGLLYKFFFKFYYRSHLMNLSLVFTFLANGSCKGRRQYKHTYYLRTCPQAGGGG